ncbi:MAG: methyltransferase domain-containing protein [Chloroflexi bacterium]|nr:methyltransferase domain-containing protein [Chloroflexota bacterium]
MSEPVALDAEKQKAFIKQVVGDTAGFSALVMANLGDRLGLFKDLAANGPAASAELAARLALHERYVREWLYGMHAAGYLTYSADSGRFSLPPEHVDVLATDDHSVFFGGTHQFMLNLAAMAHRLPDAFRNGGGIHPQEYDADTWVGLERAMAAFAEVHLLSSILPAMPAVRTRLEQGAHVADIGCGAGRAVLKLAAAFPRSQFTGYDIFAPAVERARQNAQAAGLAERVRFEVLDGAQGLPEQYDIITTFDVVHDSPDPLGLLRSIHGALSAGGAYIMQEWNCADNFTENIGPRATFVYGFSLMYCMTTSLSQGGAGLGTFGLPEPKVRQFCAEAGFAGVRRLPVEHPGWIVYEITP